MKQSIVNFLVHILSLLVPLEDHLNAALKKAAANSLVKSAESALASEFRIAAQIQADARKAYDAKVAAAKAVTPVVTAAGAAQMVAAATSTQDALKAA